MQLSDTSHVVSGEFPRLAVRLGNISSPEKANPMNVKPKAMMAKMLGWE